MNNSLFNSVNHLSKQSKFNSILKQTFKLMNFYAGKTNAGKLGLLHDDMVQEMMIKVYDICSSKSYCELPEEELLYISKKSIANYRSKIIRDQSTKTMAATHLIDLDETFGEAESSQITIDQLEAMVSKHSLQMFRELLTPDARKVVKLLVSPPRSLSDMSNTRTGRSTTSIPKKTIAKYLDFKRSYVNKLVEDIQDCMRVVYPELCPLKN